MLIGIRHPEGVVEGAEYAKMLATHLDGKTRIYNPRNIKEFSQTIKEYNPTNPEHLILLSTHYDYLPSDDSTNPYWRYFEVDFDNKGGTVWGQPTSRENITYVDELRDDPDIIVQTATYTSGKSISTRRVSKTLHTRGTTDPHTLVFSFLLNSNKLSNQAKFILSSLPPYMGKADEYGWAGFAFATTSTSKTAVKRLVDWYSESTVVTLGDRWHGILTDLGIEHNAVTSPPMSGRMKDQTTYQPYGYHIREASKSNYSVDLRNWKP